MTIRIARQPTASLKGLYKDATVLGGANGPMLMGFTDNELATF
jgi:hypothetical protein